MEHTTKILLFEKPKSSSATALTRRIKKLGESYDLVHKPRDLETRLKERSYYLLIWLDQTPGNALTELMAHIQYDYPTLFMVHFFNHTDWTQFRADLELNTNWLNHPEDVDLLLNNALHLARRQNEQSELSSMLLHDLRSPTQSILGYLELLEQEIFGPVNQGQRQILENTLSLGDTVIELMEELSQVFQFEKRKFALMKAAVQAKQLADEALKTLWVLADQKNIKLSTQIAGNLPKIYVDSSAIQRVLINLLSNAIKYTPENGLVRLQAQVMASSSKQTMLEFSIIDSGPGIPSEHLSDIFDKYYRLHRSASGQKGIGLGLYISRLLVEAHGGRIGVYNNREGGSTFYFTLPLADRK